MVFSVTTVLRSAGLLSVIVRFLFNVLSTVESNSPFRWIRIQCLVSLIKWWPADISGISAGESSIHN